jgi:hypothetical protein
MIPSGVKMLAKPLTTTKIEAIIASFVPLLTVDYTAHAFTDTVTAPAPRSRFRMIKLA